jgi:DegV family protein with EDD domain
MARIAVVTDSAANLPSELARRNNISVIPLNLHWYGRTFHDGIDLTAGELYRLLRSDAGELPSSSSPSVGDFLRVFLQLADSSEGVVSIHLASTLSATWAAAQQAALLVENRRVRVIDSRSATMGCGFVALAAARAAAKGADIEEVTAAAYAIADRVHVYGVVDSLRYVQRSGRVPAIAAVAGSLLDIHPLLYVENGRAGLLKIQRTKRRAVQRLLDVIAEKAAGRPIHAAVMHADIPDEAAALRQRLAERCDCCELLLTEFTPVMGAHAGPGLLAVAFYPEVP